MVHKNLTVDDLTSIIKTCSKMNVTELKLGDLSLSFGVGQAKKIKTNNPDAEISDTEREETNAQALLEVELSNRDEELSDMLITDPVAYEELITAGELEREGQPIT